MAYSLSVYNPNWANEFIKIKELVLKVFGDKALKIEHIGSTSVEGMVAKPLIDVLVVVKNVESLKEEEQRMIKAGYEWRHHTAPADALLFYKIGTDGEKTENVHVCAENSPMVRKFIVMRDYLRAHPKEAGKYSDLKQKSAELYPDDYLAYRDAKAPFLQQLEQDAYKWKDEAKFITTHKKHGVK